MTMYYCEDYGLSWTMLKLVLSLLYIFSDLFWRLPIRRGSQNKLYIKNRGIYVTRGHDAGWGQVPGIFVGDVESMNIWAYIR
jgi:hypothetical protein